VNNSGSEISNYNLGKKRFGGNEIQTVFNFDGNYGCPNL